MFLIASRLEGLVRQSPQVTPSTGRFQTGHDHMADIRVDAAHGGVSDSRFSTEWLFQPRVTPAFWNPLFH